MLFHRLPFAQLLLARHFAKLSVDAQCTDIVVVVVVVFGCWLNHVLGCCAKSRHPPNPCVRSNKMHATSHSSNNSSSPPRGHMLPSPSRTFGSQNASRLCVNVCCSHEQHNMQLHQMILLCVTCNHVLARNMRRNECGWNGHGTNTSASAHCTRPKALTRCTVHNHTSRLNICLSPLLTTESFPHRQNAHNSRHFYIFIFTVVV